MAQAFTISLKLGFIPHVCKIAVLCMLIMPDKPPSQTTSYRPISLLSAIMKLFERVIEKRLRKHLEDNGFFSKYQSGFRKSKSTNDHLFRLSQTIMESFNRGEHVIAAFPDLEKAFDSVWHNGLRYKIYPCIKFLGITFDNRMTFTKHFQEILEHCNQKFHRLRILVNKKWGPSPETILQIYKQCIRPIFEYGIVSTITFGNCHHKNTKSPELFHKASTSPPKVCVGSLIT